jgi:hypothetical protein
MPPTHPDTTPDMVSVDGPLAGGWAPTTDQVAAV